MTVPIPLSIDIDVAPETTHARVDDPPAAMLEGEAVKDVKTGSGAAVTVTVVVAVTGPLALVAVSV